jgi:Peptidase family M23
MRMTSEIARRQFLQQGALAGTAVWLQQLKQGSPQGEYEVTLGTWPHRIFKENDGILEPASTESFVFNLLVEKNNRAVDPLSARLEFYSGGERVNMIELSKKALEAIRDVSIATRVPDKEDEVFDFRHYFSLPANLNAERLVYELILFQPDSRELHTRLEIPLLRYQQTTKLIFPIRGKFFLGLGHDFNEPHSEGRSQHFAYDILAVGPHWEITRNGGATNADFCSWGREVIAPADATVLYARNDVPDQTIPGTINPQLYMNVPNPNLANPGNHVLLDHGNNEWSSLGHMQHGSVRVKTGDRVKQGEVLGLPGSAGDSHLPHLHYQFQMSGTASLSNQQFP